MKFEDLVAVSGLSGIFKMVANRSNGLIIEDMDTGKKKLAPSRKHQFTPLASIGIYTGLDDTTELAEVFRIMRDKLESDPPVNANSSSSAQLAEYFRKILPDYDPDRVHSGDIKKIIKWFSFLNQRDLIPEKEEETDTKEKQEAEVTPAAEEAEKKPAKKAVSDKD